MNVYYERLIRCGCGREAKQTTLKYPLDRMGREMEAVAENNFRSHECQFDITYTDWVLGEEYFYPYYFCRERKKKSRSPGFN